MTGLSGTIYEAVASDPAFLAVPQAVSLLDSHRALVTLTDGRELLVEIQAALTRSSDIPTSQSAIIQVISSDPDIAGMAPNELRDRLRVLFQSAAWCQQWNDAKLDGLATKSAFEKSERYIDGFDGSELGLTYEGALHRAVKEILAQHLWMQVPGLHVQISREGVDGQVWTRTWEAEPQRLTFTNACLEARLGRSVPDVVLDHRDGPICVEVTVTNPLTDDRETRYRQMGMPVLELDLRALSGKVTREELMGLVLTDITFKRWAFHPRQAAEHARILAEYEEEVALFAAHEFGDLVREAKERAIAWYTSDYSEELKPPLFRLLQHLELRGLASATDLKFSGFRGVLPRLLSIELGRPIGYQCETVFQVINALKNVREENQGWSTLYLAAIKTYQPPLTEENKRWVERWREDVAARFLAGDIALERPQDLDRAISAFFPELAEVLTKLRVRRPNTEQRARPENVAEQSGQTEAGGTGRSSPFPAIIEGKPYSKQELHDYLERKGLVKGSKTSR